MGKVAKLHRRLVKKRNEMKIHKRAVGVLLGMLEMYANPANWKLTERSRDVMQRGVVIGVEQVLEWNGPGNGPSIAEKLLKEAKGGK